MPDIKTEVMTVNMGPQHPSTHGVLRLVLELAGFRMFPSYIRVGGLREDLPRGLHNAVRAFLDRFPPKLDEYEDLLTNNEIYLERTRGVGVMAKDDAIAYSLVGPIARAAGVDYDVRKCFPYLGYDTFDFN